MLTYIARRLLLAAFRVWIITMLTFVIIQLPAGDSADRTIAQLMERGVRYDPDLVDAIRESLESIGEYLAVQLENAGDISGGEALRRWAVLPGGMFAQA